MSDFLKITTPLVNKNQAVTPKPGTEAVGVLNLANTTKVLQTHNQSEILKQNNGLFEDGTPTLLLNLLKDPGVTATYLQNIGMLEELYKLLPANNKTVTSEIENVFDTLLLQPDALAGEMKNQENASTSFKGTLFDFLRDVSAQNSEKPEVQTAIARLLRAIYSTGSQRDILDSVGNNLSFLRGQLAGNASFTKQLDALIAGYGAKDAAANFPALKAETLAFIKQAEESVFYDPKLAKTLSILTYNLSRFNSNPDYVTETAFRLRQYLSAPQKQELVELLTDYLNGNSPQAARGAGDTAQLLAQNAGFSGTSVMNQIVELLTKQNDSGKMSAADSLKMDGMLHSLLSSPCNFTPLLHFILPVQYDDTRSFAELWINPESDESDMPEDAGSGGMHILMVIDVDTVGRFEAEFYVYNNTVDFNLYCPKGSEAGYEEMMKAMPKLFYGSDYHLGKTQVETFEKTRSLMEVFKSLPYRRVGVDVKI